MKGQTLECVERESADPMPRRQREREREMREKKKFRGKGIEMGGKRSLLFDPLLFLSGVPLRYPERSAEMPGDIRL